MSSLGVLISLDLLGIDVFNWGKGFRVNGIYVLKKTKVGLAFTTEQAKFPNFFFSASPLHTVLVPSGKVRAKVLHHHCSEWSVLAVRSFWV